MKKVFKYEYPTDSIEQIEGWIRDKLLTEKGELNEIGYNATIIVEIIEEDNK